MDPALAQTGEAIAAPRNAVHPDATLHGLCLVVADRGFVWVGDVSTHDDWVGIGGARIVRRWGTSKGLNQLAAEGPQPETKLDAPANVQLSRRALIALIPCEAGKWPA